MNKKVAIIVVTYNRLSFLKECIESVRKQTYKDYSIIVINNGSTDSTSEWLADQNDIITITQPNLGGAGGFYTGIRYASENGYEYSWIMDDDVEANSDTLEKLMIHTHQTQGFLCSRVLDLNGSQCNVPRISNEVSKETGEWTWGDKLDHNLVEVVTTSFVSVLIPNKLAFELGLPYKEYFIWGDDTEYTTRISKAHKSYLVIDSVMIHKRSLNAVLSIFSENNPNRIKLFYFLYRNRIHGTNNIIKKFGFSCWGVRDAFSLIIQGKIKKAIIVLKGCNAGIFFHPKKYYPSVPE